jgi:uncharacterized transporter YbjL
MKRIVFAAVAFTAAAVLAHTVSSSPGASDVGTTTSVSGATTSSPNLAASTASDGGALAPDGGTAAATVNQAVPGQPATGPYSFEPVPIGQYSFSITSR